LRRLRF